MEQQHRTMIAAIQRGRFDGPNGGVQAGDSDDEPEESRPALRPSGERTTAGDRDARPGHPRLPRLRAHPRADRLLFLTGARVHRRQSGVRSASARQSSLSKQPVANASIQIRILSTVARPAGRFRRKDRRRRHLRRVFLVPAFRDGSAAAVIRVTSPIGSDGVQVPREEERMSEDRGARQRRGDPAAGGSVGRVGARAPEGLDAARAPSSATARSCRRRNTRRRGSRREMFSRWWSSSAAGREGRIRTHRRLGPRSSVLGPRSGPG